VLDHPDELGVAMQPVVRMADRHAVGYEALARFPATGSGTPDVLGWFESASEEGLGAALESVALENAFGIRHLVPDDCFLSVNVSAALLNQPAIRGVFEDAAPLHNIVVELTEYSALDAFEECRAAMVWLRELGARIAIDDVCSSYSGLQWLLELEPEFLKVDIAVVRNIDRDHRRRTMVRSIVALGRELGTTVIAEGVERPAEYAALAELDLPLAQGFLFGRPVNARNPGEVATAI